MPAAGRLVHVAPQRLARWLDGFAERHGPTRTITGERTVELIGSDDATAVIDVPFPPLTGSLLEHVLRPRRVGVLLVRRSGHAVGVFDGQTLIASKVGSSYVQGTTKAGGWSQQRYARRRTNQARAAHAAATEVAVRILAGEVLDALVAGGDREAVRAVLADPRLHQLRPVGPWLEVKDPKLRTLQSMPDQFRAVRIRLDP